MKKTLHGKRHIRARRTVKAGRDKKALRKLKRLLSIMQSMVISMRQYASAVFEVGKAVKAFGNKKSNGALKIHVGAQCSMWQCSCFLFDGKTQDDMKDTDVACLPFHDGCDCYYTEG